MDIGRSGRAMGCILSLFLLLVNKINISYTKIYYHKTTLRPFCNHKIEHIGSQEAGCRRIQNLKEIQFQSLQLSLAKDTVCITMNIVYFHPI